MHYTVDHETLNITLKQGNTETVITGATAKLGERETQIAQLEKLCTAANRYLKATGWDVWWDYIDENMEHQTLEAVSYQQAVDRVEDIIGDQVIRGITAKGQSLDISMVQMQSHNDINGGEPVETLRVNVEIKA